MGRMRTVVKRRILQALSDAEDNPHSTVAGMALGDHLYGANLDDVSFSKSLSDVRNKLFNITDLREWFETITWSFISSTVQNLPAKGASVMSV